jgi:hypothetical protein
MTERRYDNHHSRIGPSGHWCLIWSLDMIRARCTECGDCWEWERAISNGRYPTLRYKGRVINARRAVFEMAGGKLQPKSFVVVTCGNARCLNPDHLKQVTQKAHLTKVAALGAMGGPVRSAKIAAAKRAQTGKITLDDARQIRASDEPVKTLAERYGLSKDRIYRIRRGLAWREYSNPFAGLIQA